MPVSWWTISRAHTGLPLLPYVLEELAIAAWARIALS